MSCFQILIKHENKNINYKAANLVELMKTKNEICWVNSIFMDIFSVDFETRLKASKVAKNQSIIDGIFGRE